MHHGAWFRPTLTMATTSALSSRRPWLRSSRIVVISDTSLIFRGHGSPCDWKLTSPHTNTQHCLKAGPTSETLAQLWDSVGFLSGWTSCELTKHHSAAWDKITHQAARLLLGSAVLSIICTVNKWRKAVLFPQRSIKNIQFWNARNYTLFGYKYVIPLF